MAVKRTKTQKRRDMPQILSANILAVGLRVLLSTFKPVAVPDATIHALYDLMNGRPLRFVIAACKVLTSFWQRALRVWTLGHSPASTPMR
jgi:hypothetical protein